MARTRRKTTFGTWAAQMGITCSHCRKEIDCSGPGDGGFTFDNGVFTCDACAAVRAARQGEG